MAKKKKKLSTLKAKRWKLTSEYIRRKFADDNGYASCCTCGVTKHWREFDCGHFIPKNKGNAIYFEEENLAVQCQYCNRFLHGNLIEYTRYIIDLYGIEKVDELRALSKTTLKFTVADHEEAIEELKEKLEEMS